MTTPTTGPKTQNTSFVAASGSPTPVAPVAPKPPVIQEFIEFLNQYGVIGLALAVIIGGKVNALVTATVEGLIMPVVTFFIPGGTWRTAVLNVGPIKLLLGPIFGALLDFLIVGLVVFYISKWILHERVVTKK
jgi:large conductance mechanosensitive channel